MARLKTITTTAPTITVRALDLQCVGLIGTLLALVFLERLVPTAYTGQHNAIVLVAATLFLLGLAHIVPTLRVLHKLEVAAVTAFSGYLLVFSLIGGNLSEGIRYFLTLLLLASWLWIARGQRGARSFLRALGNVNKAIVLIGAGLSAVSLLGSASRISGFFVSSPTLYGYVLTLSLIAFLFGPPFRGKWLLVALALVQIIATGSRSSIAAAALVIAWTAARWLLRRLKAPTAASAGIVGLVVLIALATAGLAITSGNDQVNLGLGLERVTERLSGRTDAPDSTATRMNFYRIMTVQMSASDLVFGSGPGAAFDTISSAIGRRIPPHFDLLVFAVDFGLASLGLLALSVALVLRMRGLLGGPLVVVAIYLVSGQFHNVVFSPPAILLTAATAHYLAISMPRRSAQEVAQDVRIG